MPTSILNIGITTNKKKGMPITKVYIKYIRTFLSVINIEISHQYIIVKWFDFIYWIVYKCNCTRIQQGEHSDWTCCIGGRVATRNLHRDLWDISINPIDLCVGSVKCICLAKCMCSPTHEPLCKKIMKDFYLILIYFAIMFVLSYLLAWYNGYLIWHSPQ